MKRPVRPRGSATAKLNKIYTEFARLPANDCHQFAAPLAKALERVAGDVAAEVREGILTKCAEILDIPDLQKEQVILFLCVKHFNVKSF